MLLTITCTRPEDATWPATDLGFLLHKNPDRVQAFEQSYGTAHVLYPEATESRCTAALVLEIDPIRLVRGRERNTPDFSLGQYVNDRPYAASSLLSVAVGQVFRTALRGRCAHREELAGTALPLRLELPSVPCKGGADIAHRVFAPLGWTVHATPLPLDPAFPDWGDSHYLRLELTGTMRLADALSHLYVLLPVLDGAKHYWVAADEVDKLIRAGASWLGDHPERTWITRRYLARRHSLVRTALARLADIDEVEPESMDAVDEVDTAERVDHVDELGTVDRADRQVRSETGDAGSGVDPTEVAGDTGTSRDNRTTEVPAPSLAVMRRTTVLDTLRAAGAHRVLDLGCGEGSLLRELLADRTFTEIVGVDVSTRALNIAARRLRLDRLPEAVSRRLTLIQGSLTYTDARLRGYDAAVLMEVIEHLDPPRLGALEHAVFVTAAPATILVTTPNAEINVRFDGLAPGEFRHHDHRFEWTRAEFEEWATSVASRTGYTVRFVAIGVPDPEFGSATQMAVFTAASRADTDNARGGHR
ncbi:MULTISPECIES: 3' terminal RNA ribose 2'-O-methyltransferase Hen1 [Nocardia]|uniref:3' terminal RNA ribose 2'-O-methyltransferase Hen1 n=1 Tax=Nocardia TaxID=1817 RepID=UPI000D692962|nr:MULTISPECIES: 3' terminal RNA ribose 2'-O-methyltransferase Hen1 [Nocardia]